MPVLRASNASLLATELSHQDPIGQVNSEAIEVLENLSQLKKRFVLMSNAPRPSKNIETFLLNDS